MSRQSRVFSLLFLSTLFFIAGCMGGAQKSTAETTELSGEKLFTLKDTNGEEIDLEKTLAQKKAVLLNFWATWCPPCREEIPDLIKLQEKHKDAGFLVLGVDVGESSKKVSAFMEKWGINYPVVLDGDQRVSELYELVGIPTSILVGPDKKVIGIYYGFTPELVRDVEKSLV